MRRIVEVFEAGLRDERRIAYNSTSKKGWRLDQGEQVEKRKKLSWRILVG